MNEPRVRARVNVTGRVQGVWFRQSTAHAALSLGVTGWVRNADDGSVEAVFEGSPTAVADAIAFVRRGPEHARVDDVELSYEPPTGEPGFRID